MSVEKIDELTPIVDGLADNKACVFAYTEQAYQDNDVTGVSQYDFSKEQNIPDKNSTDTNPQVLTKGFRSQGSSIPRNFINHFIGRFSYNLNKIIDVFQSFIKAYKSDYQKNGFMYNATLPYQVGDVCMDVWSDNTFAFFVRTGNGGSTGVRPMVASDTGWTVNEHWSCLGTPQNTSQSFILRDSDGRAQVAAPSAASDIANKSYVDSTASSEADAVQTNLTSHINNQAAGVHGATSAATASKLIIRDSAGRAQVASPSAATDIANKNYVDSTAASEAGEVQTNLTSHINNQAAGVHGSTSAATAGKLMARDGAGRAQVANPSAASDIANKSYVDSTATAKADAVQTNLTNHINNQASGVHGSTSAATANKLMIRDNAGRAQVANPSAATDIANKSYVDTKASSEADAVQANLTSHINNKSNPHSVTLGQLGVTATAAELNKLDGLQTTKTELGYLDGVTSNVQTQLNAKATTASLTSHINNQASGVHGSTSSATAGKLMIRDSAGRAQVANPSAASDIANKSYVDSTATAKADAVQTNLTSHINNQASGVHGSTSAATAGKLMIRDSAGRAQVATPSAATDIANKQYVDSVASAILPVGFIYIQLKGQSAPNTLFGGTWQNISSSFAGEFFRSEGGNAAAFGSSQTQSTQPHVHTFTTRGMSANATGTFIGGKYDNFTGTPIPDWNGTGCVSGSRHSYDGFSGAYDDNSIRYTINVSHTHSGTTNSYGATETRPVNSTIRIWKRTA